MNEANAFIGKTKQPTSDEVDLALGKAAPIGHSYLTWLAEEGVKEQEWTSVSAKYGWGLRMKLKKRTIVYLGPAHNCMTVSFVLGDRAVAAAKSSELASPILKVIEDSPKYAEGTGVRLIVKKPKDLAPIKLLTRVKLDK